MNRISISNGCWFEYEDKSPLVGVSGHRYYPAVRRSLHPGSNAPTEDKGYLLVVSNNLSLNAPAIAHWRSRMTLQEKNGLLPKSISAPIAYLTLEGRAAYVVRLPGKIRDYKLASPKNHWDNFMLLFELCYRGIMEASTVRLEASDILVNENNSCLFVDTMPGSSAAPLFFYPFLKAFRGYCDVARIEKMISGRSYETSLDEFRKQATILAQRPEGSRQPPAKIDLMIALTVSGKTTRRVVTLGPDKRNITLGALLPGAKLPNRALMRIFRRSDGVISLLNLSKYTWNSMRYSGMPVRPNSAIAPRPNEIFTIQLEARKIVRIKVQRFLAAQTPAPHAEAQPIHDATGRVADPTPRHAPAATAVPAPAPAPSAPVSAAAKRTFLEENSAPKQLSDLYSCDAPGLPKPGRSISAVELASGRRVTLECCHCSDPALREELIARRSTHTPPIRGLCGLVGVHPGQTNEDFILASEAPSGEGWLCAGSPALRALPREQLYALAEAMMRLLAEVVSRGLVPARFLETRLLVRPQTGEACFADGAWLVREDKVNLKCTLGYRPPEAYAPEHRAALPDVSFCAAVWLYRLLVGGYPLEGARTRRALWDAARTGGGAAPAGEAELAERLYGSGALFAFDPRDAGNSIEALGGAYEEQLVRWETLPEALREGWIQTLSNCLHENAAGRVSPARWAELLQEARRREADPCLS